MNRRDFIRSTVIGILAGPALLKRAVQAAPAPKRPTVTIGGVEYLVDEVKVNEEFPMIYDFECHWDAEGQEVFRKIDLRLNPKS